MRASLFSKVNCAAFFCLLGAISPAFPWYVMRYYYSGGVLPMQSSTAYADWHGAALSVTGGVGLLMLLATGGLKPAPWWRTLGVGIIGAAMLVITIIYSTKHWNHFPLEEYGGLFAIISATGLLVIVALEIREALARTASQAPVT